MHVQKRHAAVDHVHAVIGGDPGDRSASSLVHLPQLRRLPAHACVVQNPAQRSDVFRAGVIGTGFSSGTGVFVEHHALPKIGSVLFLKGRRIIRVKGRAHVGGKHMGALQAPAEGQIRISSRQLHHLCRAVFKIPGLHAGGAHAADLLLVRQQADGGVQRVLRLQLCQQGGKRTDPVVLPVSHDHAPVQSEIPCRSRGHRLQFRRQEILFLHAVLFLKKL